MAPMAANQDAFVNVHPERALEFLLQKFYEQELELTKFRNFVPITHDVPAGAEAIAYYQYEEYGEANVSKTYSTDAPPVGDAGKKFSRYLVSVQDKFLWTVQEARNASLPGAQSVDLRKMNVARRVIERKLNVIAATGWTEIGWEGLVNLSSVTPASGLNGAWNSGGSDPDEIVADVAVLWSKIIKDTKENHQGNLLLLPVDQDSYISTTRLGDGSDTTIKAYIKANFPGLEIDRWDVLAGAGGSSSNRMVMLDKNPEVLNFEIPLEFTALPPQQKGYVYEVFCEARTGGLQVRLPKAIAYGDGI